MSNLLKDSAISKPLFMTILLSILMMTMKQLKCYTFEIALQNDSQYETYKH